MWRSGGVFVDSFGGAPDEGSCDLEPDALEYPSPLVVGAEWTTDSRCEDTDGTTLRVVASNRVARIERVTVGGQAVEAHVIERTGRLEFGSPFGTGRADFERIEHFAVSVGLTVRDSTSFHFTEGAESAGEGREERELVSLTPS